MLQVMLTGFHKLLFVALVPYSVLLQQLTTLPLNFPYLLKTDIITTKLTFFMRLQVQWSDFITS